MYIPFICKVIFISCVWEFLNSSIKFLYLRLKNLILDSI